jgi:hypothetical protein
VANSTLSDNVAGFGGVPSAFAGAGILVGHLA